MTAPRIIWDDEAVSDLLGPSRRGSGSSSSSENEIECADLAALDVPDLHHELGIEDAVTLIGRLSREIELGGEGRPAGRLHLHVDVSRASRILRGHDGLEPVVPGLIGELMAAQPLAGIIVPAAGLRLP